jgi:acyl-CoA thioesterase-2
MATASDPAILDALDGLLRALELDEIGPDRYRLANEPSRFPQLFGGQLVAQALRAMSATVPNQEPHSVHAYFVEGGSPDEPIEVAVDRVRDGRSLSTRRATVSQGDRCVLFAMSSFHTNGAGTTLHTETPPAEPPESLPSLQDWAANAPDERGDLARLWIDRPPPLEIRLAESPTFLTRAKQPGPRSYWVRLPRAVDDDRRLHAVLLTYASDYFLVDQAVRNRPDAVGWAELVAPSVDHAVWLHRPVHLDHWHLYTQQTLALDGERALVQGQLRDRGEIVATVTQEILMRRARAPRPDASD